MRKLYKILVSPSESHEETSGSKRFRDTAQLINETSKMNKKAAAKIALDAAKQRGTETLTAFSIPMLGTELVTYGPLAGTARLAVGSGTASVGSNILGKAGDYIDKKAGTDFIGNIGRIVGGFGGYGLGIGATSPLLRSAAGKGITLYMPQETFNNLRGQYFDNYANKVSKNFNKGIVKSYPVYHGGEFIGDSPLISKGDEFGFHVTTDRNVAESIVNSGKSGANKVIDPSKGVIREGQLTIIGKPLKTFDWGTWTSSSANNLLNGPNGYNWNRRWLKRHGLSYPEISKYQYHLGEGKNLSVLDNPEKNAEFAQLLKEHGIQAIEYPNIFEGPSENKSFAVVDPNSIKLSAQRIFIPKPIDPQTAATTYHFDGRIPMSKSISEAEKLGIPKGERSSLTQDQIDALEDLIQYNRSGKYKTTLYIDDSGKIHWGKPKEDSKTFIQEAVDSGISNRAYGKDGVSFRAHDPYYNGTVTVGYEDGPKMTAYALKFPTDWGSATFSSTPEKTGNLILTSPRSDFYDPRGFGIENEAVEAGKELPNVISKSLMKDFWRAADDLIQPGTYLSGDTGTYPLGLAGIRDIRDRKGMTSAISKILFPEKSSTAHANGLSVDSFSSIIRQGQRPGKSLRWGQGFTKWNDSGVVNKQIYDAWVRMNNGEITPEQYKQIFDNWSLSLGGRPAEIRTTPAFRTVTDNNGVTKTVPQEAKKYVIMPHPYIYYQKQGGIIKGQNGFLNTWQKAYNSKFGKGLRDFLYGKDRDLSDEEYLEKYGYNKPVGGIGVLGALVAPEWEGLEIPEITAQHFGNQGKVLRWFESGNSKMLKVPVKETSKNVSNWQKFLKLSQQEQDDFVRRWNGESFQGFATLKGDKQALSKFKSWINSRK